MHKHAIRKFLFQRLLFPFFFWPLPVLLTAPKIWPFYTESKMKIFNYKLLHNILFSPLTPETFRWIVICEASRFPSSTPQYSSSVLRFNANNSFPDNPFSFLTVGSLNPLPRIHLSTSSGDDVCWMNISGVFTISKFRRRSLKSVKTFFNSSCMSSTWPSLTEDLRAIKKTNWRKLKIIWLPNYR